jgi:hypothetical protein
VIIEVGMENDPGGTMLEDDLAFFGKIHERVSGADNVSELRQGVLDLITHFQEKAQYHLEAGDMCPD